MYPTPYYPYPNPRRVWPWVVGGVVVVGALGWIVWYRNHGGATVGPNIQKPPIECVPGQTEGVHRSAGGTNYKWELDQWTNHYSLLIAVQPGGQYTKVAEFRIETTPEQLCEGVKNYFRQQGLAS